MHWMKSFTKSSLRLHAAGSQSVTSFCALGRLDPRAPPQPPATLLRSSSGHIHQACQHPDQGMPYFTNKRTGVKRRSEISEKVTHIVTDTQCREAEGTLPDDQSSFQIPGSHSSLKLQ